MEVERKILGGNPAALIHPIPDMCAQTRTITLNKLKVLHIFRDRRTTAMDYINDTLPRLIIMDKPQIEKLKRWFWLEMPDNGYLEFDFGKKTLSFCLLKKK